MKRLPNASHESVGSQQALPNASFRPKSDTLHVAPPSSLTARTMPAPYTLLASSTTWFGSSGSIAMAASDWLPPRRVMLTFGETVAARAGVAPTAWIPRSVRPARAASIRVRKRTPSIRSDERQRAGRPSLPAQRLFDVEPIPDHAPGLNTMSATTSTRTT